MNKKQIVASLNKIANELDNNGLYTEASALTTIMSRLAIDVKDLHNMENYFSNDDLDEDDTEELDEEDLEET